MHHDERTRCWNGIGAIEIAGQGGALIWNLDRLDGQVEQLRGLPEAGDALLIRMAHSGVGRIGVQEELGVAVVVRCAQQTVARAHAAACPKGRMRFRHNCVGGRLPLMVPPIVVAGLDPGCRHHCLAELRTAVIGSADDAQRLEPELRVIAKHEMRHAGWARGRAARAGLRACGERVRAKGPYGTDQ